MEVILGNYLELSQGAKLVSYDLDLVSTNGSFRWYNDTAEVKKLGNSKGILAFSYQGERVRTTCPSAFPKNTGKTGKCDGYSQVPQPTLLLQDGTIASLLEPRWSVTPMCQLERRALPSAQLIETTHQKQLM